MEGCLFQSLLGHGSDKKKKAGNNGRKNAPSMFSVQLDPGPVFHIPQHNNRIRRPDVCCICPKFHLSCKYGMIGHLESWVQI